MSHRPEDVYEFVATRPLMLGNVRAYNTGDPVPRSAVETHELDKDGGAVLRSEWDERPADEPERAMVRGEMPPHLRAQPEESGEDKTARTAASKGTGTAASTSKTAGAKPSAKSGE